MVPQLMVVEVKLNLLGLNPVRSNFFILGAEFSKIITVFILKSYQNHIK